jgi:hypothetical protein
MAAVGMEAVAFVSGVMALWLRQHWRSAIGVVGGGSDIKVAALWQQCWGGSIGAVALGW